MQGAYRDDDGKPVVLDCVREAEKRVAGDRFMEYARLLPVLCTIVFGGCWDTKCTMVQIPSYRWLQALHRRHYEARLRR